MGDTQCAFYREDEYIPHLFFMCRVAKYVWSLVAFALGADNRPTSFEQYWLWIQRHLKNKKHVYLVGLAAICWATWKTRNKACFEKRMISSPMEIICLASSFLSYWTGLQKGSARKELEIGAEALKMAAINFHPRDTEDEMGLVLLQ